MRHEGFLLNPGGPMLPPLARTEADLERLCALVLAAPPPCDLPGAPPTRLYSPDQFHPDEGIREAWAVDTELARLIDDLAGVG